MMRIVLWLCCLSPLAAAEPVDTPAVSRVLEAMIVAKIPSPAVDTKSHWGEQQEFIVGWDVKRRGTLNWVAKPEVKMMNHGQWLHLTVTIPDPARKLHLELTNLKSPQPGTTTFQAALRADTVDLTLKHQSWNRGVQLLSDETRARCKAAVHLDCQLTQRLETKPGATLPEAILRLDVEKAELFYTDLHVEHALGVGGDAAKIIGQTMHTLLTRVKPSVERDLIAKANAAIKKAADDKEVKLNLSQLLSK